VILYLFNDTNGIAVDKKNGEFGIGVVSEMLQLVKLQNLADKERSPPIQKIEGLVFSDRFS
jgi:hypothetical protein